MIKLTKRMGLFPKAIALSLSLSSVFITADAIASDQKFKLKLATAEGDKQSPVGKSMDMWADLIKQKTDGRIKVNVYYKGELGGQQEMFDQLIKGNIDMMITWPLTSYDRRIGVIDIPYLVTGWDDALAAYGKNGWLLDIIDPIFQDVGLKYFGPYPEGFGGIATRGKHATNISDAKGIKVRSQTRFPLPQTINSMGYQAIPIDWNEVYTSIQTGVVDGDGSNVIYWDYEYFGDILTHYVHTKHNFSAASLVMNANTWGELDNEDRAIIEEAAQEVIAKQFSDAKAEDDHWIAKAQEGGMTYIEIQGDELTALIQKVRSEVWPQAQEILGEEIMMTLRQKATAPD